MGKRVRITNDRLNSYGTRVLTSGMDVEQYKRNPVLLYMHERGNVIGLVKDLKTDGDELTGELVFDEATELSRRCKKQFEFGSLKMVSAGIDVLELSDDRSLVVDGQTRPTISRSKLFEVSLVDIGANDDALVLKRDGKQITMGRDGDCSLPLLHNQPKTIKTEKEMELKTLSLQLGLPETADEAAVSACLCELKAAKDRVAALEKENETLTLARIEAIVDGAVSEKRIGAEKKEHFMELGKKVGAEELSAIFDAMTPAVKLSSMLPHGDGAPVEHATEWQKLSDVPALELMRLRTERPEEYKRLYRAEYGMGCEL